RRRRMIAAPARLDLSAPFHGIVADTMPAPPSVIEGKLQRAFQLAADAWSLLATDVLERRITEALHLVPSRIDESDPRIDIALRHRILRAGLKSQEASVLIAAVNGVP